MKNQIKELRVKIDGLAQLTKELKPIIKRKNPDFMGFGQEQGDPEYLTEKRDKKEIDKATDNLCLAKCWLGKFLGELGTETPYKNDGNRKSVKDIEPTADVANKIKTGEGYQNVFEATQNHWSEKSHIEKVDWLRQEINNIVYDIKLISTQFADHRSQRPTRELSIARTNAYTYACEARFWLGFELERIKNQEA